MGSSDKWTRAEKRVKKLQRLRGSVKWLFLIGLTLASTEGFLQQWDLFCISVPLPIMLSVVFARASNLIERLSIRHEYDERHLEETLKEPPLPFWPARVR